MLNRREEKAPEYIYIYIYIYSNSLHILCLCNNCFFGLGAYLGMKAVCCRVGDQSEREILNIRRTLYNLSTIPCPIVTKVHQ